MTATRRVAVLTLLCLAGAAGGCSIGSDPNQGMTFAVPMWMAVWAEPPAPEDYLEAMVKAPDPDRRRAAIDALSASAAGEEDRCVAAYARVLDEDEDAAVRASAVRAIGRTRNRKHVGHLVKALSDRSSIVRWDAAVALEHFSGDPAGDALSEHALDDASEDVRAACARSLRSYPQPAVLRALVRCLRDESFSVRYRAQESLVALTGRDFGYDAEGWVAAREGKLPATRPAAGKAPRPWWDMLGVAAGREPEKRTKRPPTRRLWDIFGLFDDWPRQEE